MPLFAYTARNESGAPASGTIEAPSVDEVTRQLRAGGKYPISVAVVQTGHAMADSTPRSGIYISRADAIQVLQQLAIMVETGVTLAEALNCIALQAVKPNVQKLVHDLEVQVQGGSDFSSALTRHSRSFPRIVVALIKAAERSGMLSRLLNRAVSYLRDEQEILRRVRGALTYPAIMLSFAIGSTIFLLAFVLPKFTVIYANKGAALPTPTRVLMAVSDFIVYHWPILLGGAAALTAVVYLYVSTAAGTRVWHFIQLRIPLVGPMFRKLHLSRGLRMIGTMAGAGVHLVDCVITAHDLCGNVHFQEMWDQVCEQIRVGRQMSESLAQSPLVPRSVTQMIHSAEKSGKLAHITEQVAGFSEQELKDTIADLTRYIEPAMIVIMGFVIGGVALALMLPIFTISRVVAH